MEKHHHHDHHQQQQQRQQRRQPDEVAATRFASQFRRRYGKQGPSFTQCSLEDMTDLYHEAIRRYVRRKMLAIYLNFDGSPRSDLFCSEVLCRKPVAEFLNAHCKLLGWELSDEEPSDSVDLPPALLLTPTVARTMDSLTPEVLPALVVLTYTQYGWEVLAIAKGDSKESDVMECLQVARELFEAQDVINQQRAEEKQDTQFTRMHMRLMDVGVNDTRRITREVGEMWSCPLSLEYEQELTALERELDMKEKERRKKERKWGKLVGDAVLSGEEAAVLRVLTSGEGDLQVCVSAPYSTLETCSLLTLAAWKGHVHLLPLLLNAGLSVEGHGTSSWTPLMVGAIQGHEDMVEALLNCGAKRLAQNNNGQTALHMACQRGHGGCVALLLPATPVDVRDKAGHTPVHAASLGGHFEVVLQLGQAGWGLHAKDKQGNTPLHAAAWGGCRELVQYLVAEGLSPELRSEENKTPLDLAVERGNHDVEEWIVKHRRRRVPRPPTLEGTLALIRRQKDTDARMFEKYKLAFFARNVEGLRDLLEWNDPHLVDEEGRTILHILAEKDISHIFLAHLFETYMHPHTRTHAGHTPLDLVQKQLRDPNIMPTTREYAEEALAILQSHRCPQIEAKSISQPEESPEELYKELLTVISKGDDWRKVSRLLCAGVPMERAGDLPGSALQQAVTNDRPCIVSLLLACGASLTHSFQGLNLLQQAWYSPNTTARVHRAILTAFSCQLKRERERLPRGSVKGLREDFTQVIEAVDGEEPWAARWPEEGTRRGRSVRHSVVRMTDFMSTAARINCPLMVSFLRWAGAWPFLGMGRGGATPLHAAIQARHLGLVEAMVRDLGASLYIPDAMGCLPRDMDQLTPDFLAHLEQLMYRRERGRLEALKLRLKDKSEKEKVEAVVALQETLFMRHKEGQTATAGEVAEAVGMHALLVACRDGLLQMLHLLLAVGGLPPDSVLDTVCGTTALHEAAAHGKSGCVAHLLHALQAAAAANTSNVAAIAAAAATTSVRDWRLDRYSPLQPDWYGQTALHLAAMFGHSHTLELLQHSVGRDTPCRAGTTAQEVQDNFVGYLRRYRRYNDSPQTVASPLNLWEPQETLKRLLHGVDLRRLPSDARRANVDFGDDKGEAAQVRQAVLRAVGIMLGRAAYMPGRRVMLRLVGSSRDGSKLFAPDEFDINVVVPAGECVRVTVQKTDQMQGHPLVLGVETKEPELQGPQLAEGLQQAVSEALTHAVLDEPMLSVVPPGLIPTQVGVSLNLAWQGEQYPLLLVGVDLVPVLEVQWHHDIERPPLTPPGTATMHLSATRDVSGSWRCSFAQLEAEVLGSMAPEQRLVQLGAKLLLANLKAERWMPRRVKALSTWWCGRPWTVPVPGGFCLKSCLFRLLEKWQQEGHLWGPDDTIVGLIEVFEEMCCDKKTNTWRPQQIKAYFGGDFEKAKDSSNALLIMEHLKRATTRRQRCLHGLSTLKRWWWRWVWQRRLAWLRG